MDLIVFCGITCIDGVVSVLFCDGYLVLLIRFVGFVVTLRGYSFMVVFWLIFYVLLYYEWLRYDWWVTRVGGCFKVCIGRLGVWCWIGLLLFVCKFFVILLLKLLGLVAFWETLLWVIELFDVNVGLQLVACWLLWLWVVFMNSWFCFCVWGWLFVVVACCFILGPDDGLVHACMCFCCWCLYEDLLYGCCFGWLVLYLIVERCWLLFFDI